MFFQKFRNSNTSSTVDRAVNRWEAAVIAAAARSTGPVDRCAQRAQGCSGRPSGRLTESA